MEEERENPHTLGLREPGILFTPPALHNYQDSFQFENSGIATWPHPKALRLWREGGQVLPSASSQPCCSLALTELWALHRLPRHRGRSYNSSCTLSVEMLSKCPGDGGRTMLQRLMKSWEPPVPIPALPCVCCSSASGPAC